MNITESELFPMHVQGMVDMLSEAYTALIPQRYRPMGQRGLCVHNKVTTIYDM
jgi:hypothetical protein